MSKNNMQTGGPNRNSKTGSPSPKSKKINRKEILSILKKFGWIWLIIGFVVGGVFIIINRPARSIDLYDFHPSANTYTTTTKLYENHLYQISWDDSIFILNLSNRNFTKFTPEIDNISLDLNIQTDISIQEHYLFVPNSNNLELLIYDLSIPMSPQYLNKVQVNSTIENIVLKGEWMYCISANSVSLWKRDINFNCTFVDEYDISNLGGVEGYILAEQGILLANNTYGRQNYGKRAYFCLNQTTNHTLEINAASNVSSEHILDLRASQVRQFEDQYYYNYHGDLFKIDQDKFFNQNEEAETIYSAFGDDFYFNFKYKTSGYSYATTFDIFEKQIIIGKSNPDGVIYQGSLSSTRELQITAAFDFKGHVGSTIFANNLTCITTTNGFYIFPTRNYGYTHLMISQSPIMPIFWVLVFGGFMVIAYEQWRLITRKELSQINK